MLGLSCVFFRVIRIILQSRRNQNTHNVFDLLNVYEGIKLALTALAPTEKSENLIYPMLPLALCLALSVFLSPDPSYWTLITGIGAPILTLILYETSPDEKFFKAIYRAKMREMENVLQDSFILLHLFIKSWQPNLNNPFAKDIDCLMDIEVENYIQNSISSYYITKRFWRLRAFFYVLPSILLFSISGGMIYLRLFSHWIYLGGTLSFSTIIGIGVIILLCFAHKERNKKLDEHILSLIKFIHYQITISTDISKNPERYEKEPTFRTLSAELEANERILLRRDWSIFISRWERFRRSIEALSTDRFDEEFRKNAFTLLSGIIDAEGRMRENATREFAWFVRYSIQGKKFLSQRENICLLNTLEAQLELSFEDITHPTFIVKLLPCAMRVLASDDKLETGDVLEVLARSLKETDVDVDTYNLKISEVLHYLTEKHEVLTGSVLQSLEHDTSDDIRLEVLRILTRDDLGYTEFSQLGAKSLEIANTKLTQEQRNRLHNGRLRGQCNGVLGSVLSSLDQRNQKAGQIIKEELMGWDPNIAQDALFSLKRANSPELKEILFMIARKHEAQWFVELAFDMMAKSDISGTYEDLEEWKRVETNPTKRTWIQLTLDEIMHRRTKQATERIS